MTMRKSLSACTQLVCVVFWNMFTLLQTIMTIQFLVLVSVTSGLSLGCTPVGSGCGSGCGPMTTFCCSLYCWYNSGDTGGGGDVILTRVTSTTCTWHWEYWKNSIHVVYTYRLNWLAYRSLVEMLGKMCREYVLCRLIVLPTVAQLISDSTRYCM